MPYDDRWEDDEDEPCDHEEEEMDILSGRAFCWRCGSSRLLSDYDIQAQADHEAAYAREEARWRRWQWWRDLKGWASSLIPRRRQPITDDDIPF